MADLGMAASSLVGGRSSAIEGRRVKTSFVAEQPLLPQSAHLRERIVSRGQRGRLPRQPDPGPRVVEAVRRLVAARLFEPGVDLRVLRRMAAQRPRQSDQLGTAARLAAARNSNWRSRDVTALVDSGGGSGDASKSRAKTTHETSRDPADAADPALPVERWWSWG